MSTLQKNDNSITCDSGPCPSLTEHEYKPRFFDKPDCINSDKENIPPIELVTPPSLRNLILEEDSNELENEATSWEANVARNLETLPRASSPHLRKTRTLEDLELDTDDDMIDVSDFFERPSNDKRSPRPKQTTMTHSATQGHCPTPQSSPTYILMNTATAVAPAKPHKTKIRGILLDIRKVPCGLPACLRRQPPRVAFKNNDIYMINDGDGNTYEEPKERHHKVQYKLKVYDNPTAKNMPQEEEYDDNNYRSP